MTAYAELQVTTNFSFLRGASHARELVRRAAALGHRAIGVTDRNTLAGVVRAHMAARARDIQLVVGARLDLCRDLTAPDETSGASYLCYPTDRAAYGRLSRLLTLGKGARPRAHAGSRWKMCSLTPRARSSSLSRRIRHMPRTSPPAPCRGPATSPRTGCSGAMMALAWPGSRHSPCAARRRWSRPTTFTPTRPSAAPCRTCSPASAPIAPSTRRAGGFTPTPSTTSSRRPKWRGSFAARRRSSREPWRLPKPLPLQPRYARL